MGLIYKLLADEADCSKKGKIKSKRAVQSEDFIEMWCLNHVFLEGQAGCKQVEMGREDEERAF